MTKKELSVAFMALLTVACMTAYTTSTTSASRVPQVADRSAPPRGEGGAVLAATDTVPQVDQQLLGDPDDCGCCGVRCASEELCIEGACVSRSSTCTGGCNPNVYVCNLVADRCVGNGSRSVNLCRWDDVVTGTALLCGTSSPRVTVVDACHDASNCGNCGIACAPGRRCFWGVCE